MELIATPPPIKVFVRKEFLYNFTKGHGEFIEGTWVSIKSIKNKALLFETLLSNGSLYDKLPINAFCLTKKSNPLSLSNSQLWDNLSYNITVIEKELLKKMSCKVMMKDKVVRTGTYLFTIDYWGSSTLAETPQEHKSQNIIALDDGSLIAYPNNRILFQDASLVWDNEMPDWIASQQEWICEDGTKWNAGGVDLFHY